MLGISKILWHETGHFGREKYQYNSSEYNTTRVGVILKNSIGQKVKEYIGLWVSDRNIMVNMSTKPTVIVIIQVYMLTSDCEAKGINSVYSQTSEDIKSIKLDVNL